MALGYDTFTQGSSQGAGVTATSFTHTPVASARAVVVMFAGRLANVVGVTECSYAGKAMVELAGQANGGAGIPQAGIWFLDGVPGGPQTVAYVKDTAWTCRPYAVTITAGLNESVVKDSGGGTNAATANPSVSSSPAASADGITFGVLASSSDIVPSARSPQTLITNQDEGTEMHEICRGTQTNTSTFTYGWTVGADAWASVMWGFKAGVDPNVAPPNSLRSYM